MRREDIKVGEKYTYKTGSPWVSFVVTVREGPDEEGSFFVVAGDGEGYYVNECDLEPVKLNDISPQDWDKASRAAYAQDQEALEAYVDSIPDDPQDNTGWSSGYYKLPEGAKELQDLIEAKNMNFAIGNIFKACYRMGNKHNTSVAYDLNKIIWYAERELKRLSEEE